MPQAKRDEIILSYHRVRRALGYLGLVFPVLLIVGGLITEGKILPSISDYYFSPLRDLMVGALAVIGMFLIAYKGHSPEDRDFISDNLLGNLAGLGAIGLAIFPNRAHSDGIETFFHAVLDDRVAIGLHVLSSFVFLMAIAVFCLSKFCRTHSAGHRRIYRLCGWVIIGTGVAAIIASGIRATNVMEARAFVQDWCLIFWFEAVGIWAFGLSWLTKGRADLRFVRSR